MRIFAVILAIQTLAACVTGRSIETDGISVSQIGATDEQAREVHNSIL